MSDVSSLPAGHSLGTMKKLPIRDTGPIHVLTLGWSPTAPCISGHGFDLLLTLLAQGCSVLAEGVARRSERDEGRNMEESSEVAGQLGRRRSALVGVEESAPIWDQMGSYWR